MVGASGRGAPCSPVPRPDPLGAPGPPVTVDRLAESFVIPTWTGAKPGMKSRDQLEKGFRATLHNTIGQFLRRSRTADWAPGK